MAILWGDGFDHWGNITNMQIGGWIYLSNDGGNNMHVSSVNPRTGLYCLRHPNNVANGQFNQLRLVWEGVSSTCGMGFAHYIPSAYTGSAFGVTFADIAGNSLISIIMNFNNAFEVWRALGANRFHTLLGTSPPNSYNPGSYNYIEIKCKVHTTEGHVEVRVNGNEETALIILGNTGTTGAIISTFFLGKIQTGTSVGVAADIDDFVLWDDTGDSNNDFLGDRRCWTSFPDGNTALAAWVPSSGASGFVLIDEVPPNTGGYITAEQPGDISEFSKGAIGIDAFDVAAVQLFALARKTDAGVANFRLGMHSGMFVENSTLMAPGTAFTYYSAIFQSDPNGVIPWTKASVNAANIRLTRED